MEDIIEQPVFQDLYLKANSEDALMTALSNSGASNYSIDIIGVIYKSVNEEETVALDGFHANLRGSFTEEQKSKLPIIDAPSTPERVWL